MSERLDKARARYQDAEFRYNDTGGLLVLDLQQEYIQARQEYRAALAEERHG